MPVDLVAIADAVLAPLYDPVGVQGLAYGLLGLKTIRRIIEFARGLLFESE